MQTEDYNRFKAVMTGMAKVYERELDGVLLDAYWMTLKAWPLEEFEQAAAHLMGNSEHMPRPSAFTGLRKAGRQTAGEAWEHVLRYVRTGSYSGYNGPGRIEAPTADAERAVNAIGGYRIIAQSEESEHSHMLHRFTQSYQEIREAGEVRQSVPQVTAPKTMSAIADLTARMRK